MDRIVLYWTVPFCCKFSKPLSEIKVDDFSDIATFVQCMQQNNYIVHNLEQKTQVTAASIRQQAWDNGEFVPEFLECYASLEENRLQPYFKQQRQFVRCSLKQKLLQEKISQHQDNGQDWQLFSQLPIQGLLTLGKENNALVTLRVILNKIPVDNVLSQLRSAFRSKLSNMIQQLLSTVPLITNIYRTQNKEPYPLIVIRESTESPVNIQGLSEEDQQLIFSLANGMKRSVNSTTWEQFLRDNQSTRTDVFMTMKAKQAFLLEMQERRDTFTRENIYSNADDNLIAAREIYNDLNYLLWIELILAAHQIIDHPDMIAEDITNFVAQICSNLAVHYDPYGSWIEKWKNVLIPVIPESQNYRRILQNFLFDNGPVDGLLHGLSIEQNLPIVQDKISQLPLPEAIDFFGQKISMRNYLEQLSPMEIKDDDGWIENVRKKFRLDELSSNQSTPYLLERLAILQQQYDDVIHIDIGELPDHAALPVEFCTCMLEVLCKEFIEAYRHNDSAGGRPRINICHNVDNKSWSLVFETLGMGLPFPPHELKTRGGLTAKTLNIAMKWFDNITVQTYCSSQNSQSKGWYSGSLQENCSRSISPPPHLNAIGSIFLFTIATNGKVISVI